MHSNLLCKDGLAEGSHDQKTFQVCFFPEGSSPIPDISRVLFTSHGSENWDTRASSTRGIDNTALSKVNETENK